MRRPMNGGDLRFALGRGDLGFGQSKAIVKNVMDGWEEGVLEGWGRNDEELDLDVDGLGLQNGEMSFAVPKINGTAPMTNGVSYEEVDDGWGWEGGGKADRAKLGSLLDECLAIGQ